MKSAVWNQVDNHPKRVVDGCHPQSVAEVYPPLTRGRPRIVGPGVIDLEWSIYDLKLDIELEEFSQG